MQPSLHGKTALVTGASEGIGLATAKQLADAGATVYMTGRRQEVLDDAVKSVGPRGIGIRADTGSLAEIDTVIQEIRKRTGKLDVLFANAAITRPEPLGQITEEAIDAQLAVNVKGLIFTVQKALDLLADGSSIIITSSIGAQKAVVHQSVYAATKSFVRSLARTWAMELKPREIRVNVVSPGPIETPGFAAAIQNEEQRSAFDAMLTAMSPSGRMGHPSELAHVVAFLASDAASFINGADIQVDGGFGQV